MPPSDAHLRVVVLAGGIGSRFWPASTPLRPKQLLPLATDAPLIRDTVDRARTLVPRDRLRILAGSHLVQPFRRALGEEDEDLFWIEPRARGTGPVLTWAAHRIVADDPDAVMVSLHADHFIEPPDAFRETISRCAALAARTGLLFTVSVTPDRPETGYGYLKPGAPLGAESDARHVETFVEKPNAATARTYLQAGYLWNSGIFVWSAAKFLEEVRVHAPEIGRHLPLLDRGEDERFFERVAPISVDEAVLERSGEVATLPATFRWDDVGSWSSLTRTRPTDERQNVTEGQSHVVDSRRNVVWSEDGPVVLFGVDDLVVARSAGVTLVAARSRAGDLKKLLARLPEDLRAPPRSDLPETRSDE